jgi:hypothetical protein
VEGYWRSIGEEADPGEENILFRVSEDCEVVVEESRSLSREVPVAGDAIKNVNREEVVGVGDGFWEA